MKLTRRKAIGGIALGAATVGAGLGTGAFSQVEADRTLDIELADDANALLTIAPNNDATAASGGVASFDGPGNLNEYPGSTGEYLNTSNGTVSIDVTDANITDAAGVNREAITRFIDLIRVENNGTQDVGVRVDAPTGVDILGFLDDGTPGGSLDTGPGTYDATLPSGSVAGVTLEVDTQGLTTGALTGETVSVFADERQNL